MKEPHVRALKVVVFLLCLEPLAELAWRYFYGRGLGANPIDVITRTTGGWTLNFILLCLTITPARQVLKQPWLIRFRKMLGNYAFFYGCLHLTTYVWLDKFFDLHEMLHDVAKRRFITAGFTAWVLMVPLAMTSTNWAIRKMGGKRWRRLHRLIYITAIAGVIHFMWLVKVITREQITYAVVLALLLLYRLAVWAAPRLKPKPKPDAEPVLRTV